MRYESLEKEFTAAGYTIITGHVVVRVYAGSETGPQSSSKGFVFAAQDGQEVPLSKFDVKIRLGYSQQQVSEHEGSGLVTGTWSTQTFAIPAGAILKLFSMGTFMGQGGKRIGGIYLMTDPEAQEIRAIGYSVQNRTRAWIQGRLRPIPIAQFAEHGIGCLD